jgi:membrane protein
MRGGRQEKIRVIGLGERSVRAFFEHPMATYAAALAYRGLFGLSPFLFILVVLVGTLSFTGSFDRAVQHAHSEASKHVPQQLQPVGGLATTSISS